MRLLGRIRPDSRLANLAQRSLMLARAAQLSPAREPNARSLRRALRSTALGRLSAEERAWIARIVLRRERVASQDARHYLSPAPAGGEGESDSVADYLAGSAEPWSIPELWGELLLRLVRELRPRSCLELGTGFGISGLYVGAALQLNGHGRLTTVDRERRLLPVAEQGFSELGLASLIEARAGAIEETLGEALAASAPVDWALIDAEHTEEATVAHFASLLPGLAGGAVVLVDDINLSEEMNRAWRRIRAAHRVSHALDLHRLGVVMISEN